MNLQFVAIGLDHRRVFGITQNMLDASAECLRFWTHGTPQTLEGFRKRFRGPGRFDTLDDPLNSGAYLALVAAIPADHAGLAVRCMHNGMDVIADKPGCTSMTQRVTLRDVVREIGKIWSINFSERFDVPAVTRASELVATGTIGTVVHTAGLGPHRLNRDTRPN